ncbi:hypothetical protein QBC41DRAFT_377522 [Cercophora samala]|uniref:ABC transporter domain-containing protein n=1 Tax=Cercophora samala TaxID=330535 RepID=A0AA40D328_9PEZI|nr:hypothetical protein QBC41DRAFT_377522 [Cercophora samala]
MKLFARGVQPWHVVCCSVGMLYAAALARGVSFGQAQWAGGPERDIANDLQIPFLPLHPPLGPTFLDTEACLCRREPNPAATEEKAGSLLWRCSGNQTVIDLDFTTGKWFKPINNDEKDTLQVLRLPMNDGSNPPLREQPLRWDPESSSLVPGTDGLGVWDQACTGENRTGFSTSYYRAVEQRDRNEAPVDAAPCWRPGAVPLRLQDVNDWKTRGCLPGFQCQNNTVNSLPQFCPPFAECQMARLGYHPCAIDGTNIGMGPFEPIICQAGKYCPPGGKATFVCPAGHYCQPGAATPTPCAVGSLCPEGSSYERYFIPLGVLIALDILIIIGIIILRFRSRLSSSAQVHQSSVSKKPESAVVGLARAVTRRKYKKISPEHDVDHEMSAVGSPPPPGRGDVWAGFQEALVMPAQSYRNPDGIMSPQGEDLEKSLPPQIRAFIDSMRKATDASEIGLGFGYSQLAFQPKGSNRPILQDITGSIRSGTLTAVMGGSGAGKSTFVNVLMGKIEYTHGKVEVNGVPGKLERYKKLIGYVPQDDIVLPELTVKENIMHSARIRLPRTWTSQEIENHVAAVIDCLELSHVRDSLVGSVGKPVISGGQRKRVSIGMELAAAPMAIFLDEPTSGLDATAASSIMRTLKAIARLGISVIAIIHQPRMEIFEMLDDLILLANGQQLYEGPESGVQPFFEKFGYIFPKHANFGDVVTDIITGNGRAYKKSGDISKDALIANWVACRKEVQSPVVPTIEVSRPGSPESGSSTAGDDDNGRATTRVSVAGPVSPFSGSFASAKSKLRLSSASVLAVGTSFSASKAPLGRLLKQRGASRFKQFTLCVSRAFLQQYRHLSIFWFEVGLATLAGFLLGLAENAKNGVLFMGLYHQPYEILSTASDFKSAPEMALLTAIAIGLVSAAPGVRVFSEEMLLHRREAEAGHSRLAYFLAKSVSILPRMTMACMHFTVPLWLLSTPIMGWALGFVANLFYFYCIFGLASVVSMLVKREDAPLFATMLALIVGILSGAAPPLSSVRNWKMEWLWRMSPGVWLAEIYFGQLVTPLGYLYDIDSAAFMTGFRLDGLWKNMGILVAIGTIYRILAFIGLVWGTKMRI